MQLSPVVALILGAVQGATEFLPISSSAHLVILPALFGWQMPAGTAGIAFDVLLHAGTLVAVIAYFATDLLSLAGGAIADLRQRRLGPDARLAALLIIATIPAGVIGLVLKDVFERAFGSPLAAGFFLIVTALILLAADAFAGHGSMDVGDVTPPVAVGIGFAQALAILPGISRSGATISGGMLFGLKRQEAARFSFLLSIPIIAATFIFELKDLSSTDIGFATAFLGFAAAAAVGYACIAFLLRYLATHRLRPFALYCLAAGAFTIAVFLLKS